MSRLGESHLLKPRGLCDVSTLFVFEQGAALEKIKEISGHAAKNTRRLSGFPVRTWVTKFVFKLWRRPPSTARHAKGGSEMRLVKLCEQVGVAISELIMERRDGRIASLCRTRELSRYPRSVIVTISKFRHAYPPVSLAGAFHMPPAADSLRMSAISIHITGFLSEMPTWISCSGAIVVGGECVMDRCACNVGHALQASNV